MGEARDVLAAEVLRVLDAEAPVLRPVRPRDAVVDREQETVGLFADRAALTRKLEALRGGPGFTGRAPGGPSRWSNERSGEWMPLKTELVVEVIPPRWMTVARVSAGV